MADCFIVDHGLLTQLAMSHAQITQDPCVALQLDQEKAYDRVKLMNRFTLLSQICLSFCGKSIVANSLLLSSVWHVQYMTHVPLSSFTVIRTHIRSFLRLGFGSPGWPLLCLPRKSGDLGLIDPDHQQRALQLCWILLILDSHSFSSTSFILPYLESILPLNFCASSASIALLFLCSSATCPTLLLPLHRACTSLLPASLPSNLQLPLSVVQHFPLTAICISVPPFVESSLNLKKKLVPDEFSMEADDRLVRKVRGTSSQGRNRIGHFFQQIDFCKMILCPWVLSCLDHRLSIDTPPPDLSSLLSLLALDLSDAIFAHKCPHLYICPSNGVNSGLSLSLTAVAQSGEKYFGIDRQHENVSTYLYLDASPAHLAFFVKILLKISITFPLAVLSNVRCGTSSSLAFACLGALLTSAFSLPEAASHHVPPIKTFGFYFPFSLLKKSGVLIGSLFFDKQPFLSGVVAQKASTVIEKHIGTLA
ncbi:hypothetical protein PHYBLDRAFT_138927 [Phycomyces blakesleeanus NRRL 1555(-)]|uniref:Reverse transcriptase domain-containing protein n=1 Tax=Phycomyces blakesleeanus (strain ATCC 8743b / DSM 1359 / FGSC 10004 / NBRC 33097 / NRRL 1555) TaxID=763407 RepID=A0A163ESY7_PHYB8|nr:hypothetical protein PHYBLDRAFT_138927 [Phycomyces blakesleeanus NRRL 1555(-)]OAD81380.1 hypothetical protein PHYBLDRAFT_138927 [Phycomyces blakesleeanus NRRL 1555(-)]|eukprot:XP_018299420.1 hypothetical protein PHYBLDRAFT_138927 [Phycomyces blakesleeanus NRRL 1555(-)]